MGPPAVFVSERFSARRRKFRGFVGVTIFAYPLDVESVETLESDSEPESVSESDM
jgi:hypothetical protein